MFNEGIRTTFSGGEYIFLCVDVSSWVVKMDGYNCFLSLVSIESRKMTMFIILITFGICQGEEVIFNPLTAGVTSLE